MFEITPEIEEHFDCSLRIKAEATVKAIAISKSIQIGEPSPIFGWERTTKETHGSTKAFYAG